MLSSLTEFKSTQAGIKIHIFPCKKMEAPVEHTDRGFFWNLERKKKRKRRYEEALRHCAVLHGYMIENDFEWTFAILKTN